MKTLLKQHRRAFQFLFTLFFLVHFSLNSTACPLRLIPDFSPKQNVASDLEAFSNHAFQSFDAEAALRKTIDAWPNAVKTNYDTFVRSLQKTEIKVLDRFIAVFALEDIFLKLEKPLKDFFPSHGKGINVELFLYHLFVHAGRYKQLSTASPLMVIKDFLTDIASHLGYSNETFLRVIYMMGIKSYKGIALGDPLGAGGTSIVFEHANNPKQVYKIFFSPYIPERGLTHYLVAKREYLVTKVMLRHGVPYILGNTLGPYPEVLLKDRFSKVMVSLPLLTDPDLEMAIHRKLAYAFKNAWLKKELELALDQIMPDGARLGREGTHPLDLLGTDLKLDINVQNFMVNQFDHNHILWFDP